MSKRDSSPLDLTEVKFHELCSRVNPLCVNGKSLSCGLPSRLIKLDELRDILLARGTSQRTKDVVWAHLVRRARAQPDPWNYAAAGMMIPGLKNATAKLARHYPGDVEDLDSEVLTGFLDAVHSVDVTQSELPKKLYWAAWRQGEAARQSERRQQSRVEMPDDLGNPELGSPEITLAQAVRDGAVTADQANLVCGIHLDHKQRSDVARSLGVSPYKVSRILKVANHALSSYLLAA